MNYNIYASEKHYVIPGGESIGIEVETGVYVTGKFDVNTNKGKINPSENSNIETDDLIIEVNNIKVKTIDDVINIINKVDNGNEVSIKLIRNNNTINTKINVVTSDKGKNSIGLYVKDKIIGVGTLTYIDPNDNTFGALGHSVSSKVEEIYGGNIFLSSIEGIRKSIPGIPGEKRAVISAGVIGKVSKNNKFGIFGKIDANSLDNEKLLEVGSINDIKLGRASIITVTSKNIKESYDIEIIELKNQVSPDLKGIKFKITDKDLLDKTGGIIQGMSGSPIIQNGKLIGAVSHVIVDNPEYGYGVYIDWMINR